MQAPLVPVAAAFIVGVLVGARVPVAPWAALAVGVASAAAALIGRRRVRITAPTALKGRITGSILSIDESSLTIETKKGKSPFVVPLQTVSRLEVSGGRRSRGRGAGLGAAIGFAAVGLYFGVLEARSECGLGFDFFSCDEPAPLAVGTGFGLLLGAPLGALIGLLIPPGERWERTSLKRVSVGIAPAPRGIGVSVSLSF